MIETIHLARILGLKSHVPTPPTFRVAIYAKLYYRCKNSLLNRKTTGCGLHRIQASWIIHLLEYGTFHLRVYIYYRNIQYTYKVESAD